VPPPAARLIVVDRPNSPSSYLMLGRLTPFAGHPQGFEAVELANEVVGNGFLSRLNNDLRETKGWTYGIRSSIPAARGQRRLQVGTQVQADRTADSIRVILDQMSAFPATRPADALLANRLLGRDLRHDAMLPALYRAIDGADIDAAAQRYLQPDDFVIVVVGDRAAIQTQIDDLGMDIEYLDATGL
jgi:predicted Zn-dependent peptidase